MRGRKKHRAAEKYVADLVAQWRPVLEMQAEAQAEQAVKARKQKERGLIKREKGYARMRAHKHEARLDGNARYTPRWVGPTHGVAPWWEGIRRSKPAD